MTYEKDTCHMRRRIHVICLGRYGRRGRGAAPVAEASSLLCHRSLACIYIHTHICICKLYIYIIYIYTHTHI